MDCWHRLLSGKYLRFSRGRKQETFHSNLSCRVIKKRPATKTHCQLHHGNTRCDNPHHHQVWRQMMQPGPVSGDNKIPSLDQHSHHVLGTVMRHLRHVAPVLIPSQKLLEFLGGGGWRWRWQCQRDVWLLHGQFDLQCLDAVGDLWRFKMQCDDTILPVEIWCTQYRPKTYDKTGRI